MIIVESVISALKDILTDEQVSVNETVRELHSKDESYHESRLPDVVVFPTSQNKSVTY